MGRDHTSRGNLSSMVVGPAESAGGGGVDFEPGEVRRERELYYCHSETFSERQGYRMRAGSGSPLRQRKVDHDYHSEFDSVVAPRGNRGGYRGGRGRGRFREFSPPNGWGRGGRSFGRGTDVPKIDASPYRGDVISRNNPNVPPRVGDWICPDPLCGNLNFARREYCNNCNRLRRDMPTVRGVGDGSPRRNYPARPPHPHSLPSRNVVPSMVQALGREMNGYGSSPHSWSREGFREFANRQQPRSPRHGERFLDPQMGRGFRERADYHAENEYRERGGFNRNPYEWGHEVGGKGRDRGEFHESGRAFHDRRGVYTRGGRRSLSPPPLPGRGMQDSRERSRSPLRGIREYNGDPFIGRGRGYKRGMERD